MKFVSKLSFVVVAAFLFASNNAEAAKSKSGHKIQLDSCNVEVTADSIEIQHNKTTYSGNVKILVGFASLKSDKVTVVKKPNGACEVISE